MIEALQDKSASSAFGSASQADCPFRIYVFVSVAFVLGIRVRSVHVLYHTGDRRSSSSNVACVSLGFMYSAETRRTN